MYKKSAYKTPTHKIKNHIKIDNKYSFNKFNILAVKKSRKIIVDTRFNKKLNKSKAEIFQSIY